MAGFAPPNQARFLEMREKPLFIKNFPSFTCTQNSTKSPTIKQVDKRVKRKEFAERQGDGDMWKAVEGYIEHLEWGERSPATRGQYRRDIEAFLRWLSGRELTKERVIGYKRHLQEVYQPASVNAKLAALNGFFSFLGRHDLRVKQLKIQRQAFCSRERELSKAEYLRLVRAAETRRGDRLSLLMQTICATGIRVSELHSITAEAVERGEAVLQLKGKTRVILLTGKLRRRLQCYLRRQGIKSGPVFITRTGRPLDRSSIWRMMKSLCAEAGVERSKVFPHNLRHLFARCFYAVDRDLAKLADILGHSNINTTRIYIISSGREHRQRMDALKLVL